MKRLQQTINSREVAKMVGRNHADVMRDVKKIISHLADSKNALGDLFIEATYLDVNNQKRPCYDLTKKGCELYSTRMTGAKGTQFAIAYIEQFNEMEKALTQPKLPTTYKEALIHLVEQVEVNEQLQLENEQLKPKADKYDRYIQAKGTITVSIIAKNYGMCARKFNELLHDLGVQYKQKNTWLLYAKYQDKRYTHIEGFTYKDSDGIKNIKTTTKWTAKGHMFLYDLLRSHGYYPNIELIDSEDDTFKMVERRK